jgi:general secretion pathway protein B
VSFILDALRKSESERRREATPSLAHLPPAAPRSHAPPWVWVVMTVLGVGLLGLAAAWWQSTQTVERGALEAPPAATEAPPASTSASGGNAEPRAVPTPSVPEAKRPADSVPTERRADGGSLPTVAEARASGVPLPELSLQLISYSEDANQRFVFINGFRYGQGQRVQNGPLIVSIAADSVVLQQQGRDFILTAE